MMFLAIDPGKDKTGLAVYDSDLQEVVYRQIVLTTEFAQELYSLQKVYYFAKVIIGDGTASQMLAGELQRHLSGVSLQTVPEAYSTLEGRKLYFQLYPPRGLWHLIPLSLQTPKRPIDDLAAVVLLARYLGEMPKIRL